MTAHAKVGGVWKDVSAISTKVGGAWKDVSEGYTKISGSWKQFFAPGGGFWAGQWTSDGTVSGVQYVKIDAPREYIYALVAHTNAASSTERVLVQMEYDGTINWQKSFQLDIGQPTDFDFDSSGNIYLASGSTVEDIVLSISPAGNLINQIRLTNGGGSGDGWKIRVAGSTVFVALRPAAEQSAWEILAFPTNLGSNTWRRRFRTSTATASTLLGDIAVDSTGDVYLIGRMHNGSSERFLAIKISNSGTLLWERFVNYTGGFARSPVVYNGFLYFMNSTNLSRINASTGVLDTSFGRVAPAGGRVTLKIDQINGNYFYSSFSDLGTDGGVYYFSETAAFARSFVNLLRVAGGTASSTTANFAFDWAGTLATTIWSISGLTVPHAIATFPQDGSMTNKSVTVSPMSYSWELSAANFSSALPTSLTGSGSLTTPFRLINTPTITLINGTLTLTKGNFA